MIDPDVMLGIQKADHDGMKEVKVKLPVRQLLRLHYMKLTSGRTFSDVITTALQEYFDEIEADQTEAAAYPGEARADLPARLADPRTGPPQG